MVKRAGIAQLKASLSEYLAAVKAGGEVVVTERGRPIAKIIPMSGRAGRSAEVQELVRAGILRPPKKALDPGFWRRRPADPERQVLRALLAERAEGR